MLAKSATDSQAVAEADWLQKLGINRDKRKRDLEKARSALSKRLSTRKSEALNELIKENGISGEAASGLVKYGEDHFGNPKNVNEPLAAVLTGAVGGFASGLGVDAISGGLSFGGGAAIGAAAGGIGAYALSKGYNLAVGKDKSVRWSEAHFQEQFQTALLSYLAVAHFGRGRGFWQEDEPPEFWKEKVEEIAEVEKNRISALWKRALEIQSTKQREDLEASLKLVVRDCLRKVLQQLYPSIKVF